jgi:lysophospholipase L1-like esterase
MAYTKTIFPSFNKDEVTGQIIKEKVKTTIKVHPLQPIIFMESMCDEFTGVKLQDKLGNYLIKTNNKSEIDTTHFYLSNNEQKIFVDPSYMGELMAIEYYSIGGFKFSDRLIATQYDESNTVTETLNDIITQGRTSIDFYNASGSAIILLEDLTAKNIEALDTLDLLNVAIDTGDIVMMQTAMNTNFAEISSQIASIPTQTYITDKETTVSVDAKLNNKANQEDLIATNEDVSATNLRIDTLVINSGDANVEVTDSHVSSVKNTTFTTIKNRFEAIEEGIDFKATNYSINGDLSNGTTGWTGGAGTISSANNILTFTANGTQAFTNYALNDSTLTSAIGKKVYATVQVRVTNSVCQSIVLNIRDSVSNVARTIENPIMNQWYTVSGLVTMSGTGIISVYVYETYADETTANGKVMEVKYLSVLDATEIFKVGNEPSTTELDKLMSYFTNSYISGFTDTIIKYRDLYNNYYELKQDYEEYKAIGIVNKSIGIDKLSDEVYEGIYSPQPITVLPTSFEYDNLTLTYVDSILSASNLARAFHSIFLPNEVAEISFQRALSEVWVILGGTSTRYTAIRITSTGIMALVEVINSGTLATDYITIDGTIKWSGAIEFTDMVKVIYKQGSYSFYKNDVLIYTLNVADVTDIEATGFKLNNKLGLVGQQDKTTDTGIAKIITANSYQSATVGLETLSSDVAELKASQTMMTSQWKDKIWNVSLDSLTAGFGTTKSYHQYIQEDLGITTVNNYGISSTEICTSGTSGDPFIGRYLSMDVNADLITVLGGSNDFLHNAELGTFDSRDNSTFYGALHNLCVGLHTNFTKSKIAFFTPLRINGIYGIDTVPNTKGYVLEDYVDAIKEVCGFYSIPVLDLFKSSGLSPYIPYMKTNYMPDGTHPNAVGHRMIADKIRAFINSL